jgi:YHS domain-containing protein
MTILLRTILLIMIIGLSQSLQNKAEAQDVKFRETEFNLESDNPAIQGYDAVSYFMGEPRKGKEELNYTYMGVLYWFNNAENLELFKKQPEKFEPAYGGWCAYAMGVNGEKVKIDPKTYKIIEGELYLFYNFYFNNTLIDWNKDVLALKQAANKYWEEIIKNP